MGEHLTPRKTWLFEGREMRAVTSSGAVMAIMLISGAVEAIAEAQDCASKGKLGCAQLTGCVWAGEKGCVSSSAPSDSPDATSSPASTSSQDATNSGSPETIYMAVAAAVFSVLVAFFSLRSKKGGPLTNRNIRSAVETWCEGGVQGGRSSVVLGPNKAMTMYGPIDKWDVSGVSDMSGLFEDKIHFNDDISAWDTSNVTTMKGMFYNARSFNQPIGKWKTAKVTNMRQMFARADAFSQSLKDWDVSNVDDMTRMFLDATGMKEHEGAMASWGKTWLKAKLGKTE